MRNLGPVPDYIYERAEKFLYPMLDRLTAGLPHEMAQVLGRPMGNLGTWINADPHCGCVVGTTALIVAFNGKIDQCPDEEIQQALGMRTMITDRYHYCEAPALMVARALEPDLDTRPLAPFEAPTPFWELYDDVSTFGVWVSDLSQSLYDDWMDAWYDSQLSGVSDEVIEAAKKAVEHAADVVIWNICKARIRWGLAHPRTWWRWRSTQAKVALRRLTGRYVHQRPTLPMRRHA